MIAFVDGVLEYFDEENAVVDVNGMGINVKISSATVAGLPSLGEKIRLYTYTSVREDAIWLYGFPSRAELALFKKIIAVNGIGPKSAQAILGAMDADSFRYAIVSQDKKTLSKLPGIGAKTAERLILELREKMADSYESSEIPLSLNPGGTESGGLSSNKKDALDALVALGYSKTDCLKAMEGLENADSMDSGALLKVVLKRL